MLRSMPLMNSAATTVAIAQKSPWNLQLYARVAGIFRDFCETEGLVQSQPNPQPSILTACEDHRTLQHYMLGGTRWALPQTGQMKLEEDLLTAGQVLHGVYCETTSFRDEPESTFEVNRHLRSFPMLECEAWGKFNDMLDFQERLLAAFGLPKPVRVNYRDVAKYYGVDLLDNSHEMKMATDIGPVVQLCYFPEETSPYANMRRVGDGTSYKCDVIIDGVETIGSAERSVDVDDMRLRFNTISEGQFMKTLHDLFGVERVEAELEEYLALFDSRVDQSRFGMGIGATRLMAVYAARHEGEFGEKPTPHPWAVRTPEPDMALLEAARL